MTVHSTSRLYTREVGYSSSDSTAYEDLQVNVGRVRFPGVNDPTWRRYDHGTGDGTDYDVLGFAVNDFVNFDIQTRHAMKLESQLDLHIHFILPNTTSIGDRFQFEATVIGAPIGGTFDTLAESPFTAEHTIVSGNDTDHCYMDIGNLNTINTTVSSIFTVRLRRIDATSNEYGSEVYVKYFDCHYELDTLGSLNENSKT